MLVAVDSLGQIWANIAIVLNFGSDLTRASLGTSATGLRAFIKLSKNGHFAVDRARSFVAALCVCVNRTKFIIDGSVGVGAFAHFATMCGSDNDVTSTSPGAIATGHTACGPIVELRHDTVHRTAVSIA
jgi:hypothetical protein